MNLKDTVIKNKCPVKSGDKILFINYGIFNRKTMLTIHDIQLFKDELYLITFLGISGEYVFHSHELTELKM